MHRMLLEHPWFAWLRPLSALIVRIDEAFGGEAAEGAPGLGERYWAAIQSEPGVALAHGAVVARLGPPPG